MSDIHSLHDESHFVLFHQRRSALLQKKRYLFSLATPQSLSQFVLVKCRVMSSNVKIADNGMDSSPAKTVSESLETFTINKIRAKLS